MNIQLIQYGHPLWNQIITYASNCSWKAGKSLAKRMMSNEFSDKERVIAAVEDTEIVGFAAFLETDGLDETTTYTPFVGYIFVDEKYRGKRISSKMLDVASEYAKSLAYTSLYVVSGEVGLYEKFGFKCIDTCLVHGREEQLFKRNL